MESFLDIQPPTVTAQEHKVRVVHGRPQFYDTAKLKAARSTFESLRASIARTHRLQALWR